MINHTVLSIREINSTYLSRRQTNRTINTKNTTDAKGKEILLPWVNVGFAALEMVMQIVPKQVDQVNRVVPRCSAAHKIFKGSLAPDFRKQVFSKGKVSSSTRCHQHRRQIANFLYRKFFHIFLRCCWVAFYTNVMIFYLKVDSNEKIGGSGRRQKFSIYLALWRSRVICNLNVLFLFKTHYFHFRLLQLKK